VALYGLLGDKVPAILWVSHWATWVCKGDIDPGAFPSLQAYLDEFPYQVEVMDDCVTVTDPGFGHGPISWMFRQFALADGNVLAVLTETDTHHNGTESKIWIGQYHENDWLELTDFVLPSISRADFFGAGADPAVLEDYELVALNYELPGNGNELHIHAMPNGAFACVDGKVMHEDLSPEQEAAICAAWDSFKPEPIICAFNAAAGKFVVR
jgi:hypothetical protein